MRRTCTLAVVAIAALAFSRASPQAGTSGAVAQAGQSRLVVFESFNSPG